MPAVQFFGRIGIVLILALSFACSGLNKTTAGQAKLETEFEESMRNVVLDGSFTINRNGEQHIAKEKYTIASAKKIGGGIWVFQTRMQYGDHDVTLPIPVKMVWAGDTPMVSLTDTSLPGLGTFTARVIFYRDSYVGFWQHGDVSGNQFGRILRNGETAAPVEPTPADGSCAACGGDEPKSEPAPPAATDSEKTPKSN